MKRLRRYLPWAAVAAALLIVGVGAISDFSAAEPSFALRPYWPSPSAYAPGTTSPTAYLEINHTAAVPAVYSYVLTYSADGVEVVLANGTALLSRLSPLDVFVFAPSQTSGGSITATVYKGSVSDGVVVFTDSFGL